MTEDLTKLAFQWEARIRNTKDLSYKEAVGECLYELDQFIVENSYNEMTSKEAYEFWESLEADTLLPEEYLS